MDLPIKDKAVSRMGRNNGQMISLPALWMRAQSSPKRISMVVGNIIIIASEDDKELAVKAAIALVEQDLMHDLGIENFAEVK